MSPGSTTFDGMCSVDEVRGFGHHLLDSEGWGGFTNDDFVPAEEGGSTTKLGKGISGSVSRMKQLSTGHIFAIKTITLNSSDNKLEAAREMLTTKFPNGEGREYLATYYGMFVSPFHTAVNIVMELMAGSMSDIAPVPEDIAARIAAMVLRGLAFMHKDAKLMHRDIKPSNILYGFDGTFKITDFGLTSTLVNQEGETRSSTTFVGTTLYMAPERLKNHGQCAASDVFAFGLSIAEIVLGAHPLKRVLGAKFDGSGDDRFWGMMDATGELNHDAARLPNIFATMPGGLSPTFVDFLCRATSLSTAERWPAHRLLEHPWITSQALGGAGSSIEARSTDRDIVRDFLIARNRLAPRS